MIRLKKRPCSVADCVEVSRKGRLCAMDVVNWHNGSIRSTEDWTFLHGQPTLVYGRFKQERKALMEY